jgi:hypothetical protein
MTDDKKIGNEVIRPEGPVNDFKAGYFWGRHDVTCGKLVCEEHITTERDIELQWARKFVEYKAKAEAAERMAKALKFYADPKDWEPMTGWQAGKKHTGLVQGPPIAHVDAGDVAREALAAYEAQRKEVANK